MAAMGPAAFAVVVWGSMLVVLAVLAFELYVLAREAGVTI